MNPLTLSLNILRLAPWGLAALGIAFGGWQYTQSASAQVRAAQALAAQAQAEARLANYMASAQAAAMAESETVRAREGALTHAVSTLGADLDKQKTRLGVAERSAANSLRELGAAIAIATAAGDSGAPAPGADTAAAARADAAATAGHVLGQCAATLVAVATHADHCEANLEGLQTYVRDMLRIVNAPPEPAPTP